MPLAVLQAQTENDTEIFEEEILEFKLNDNYSVKLRQICESEYTAQKQATEHLRHKPYEVITDIAEAQKMLGKKLKGVDETQKDYYSQLEVTYNDGVKKMLNLFWLGWNKESNNFVAYYPEVGVLILEHEASGDYPVDLNDSTNENVGNPKYYAFSFFKQLRINGNEPGGAVEGWEYWLQKWNPSNKKYEFIENLEEPAGNTFWFNYATNWFWTSNSKALFKYVGGFGSYYEMEIIEN
jgi:hypothetical protein